MGRWVERFCPNCGCVYHKRGHNCNGVKNSKKSYQKLLKEINKNINKYQKIFQKKKRKKKEKGSRFDINSVSVPKK